MRSFKPTTLLHSCAPQPQSASKHTASTKDIAQLRGPSTGATLCGAPCTWTAARQAASLAIFLSVFSRVDFLRCLDRIFTATSWPVCRSTALRVPHRRLSARGPRTTVCAEQKAQEAAHNRHTALMAPACQTPRTWGMQAKTTHLAQRGPATSPVHQAVGPAAQVGPLSQPRSSGQSGPECASQPFTQVPPSSNTGAARGVNTAGGRCSRARGRLHARPRQPLGARVRRAPAHNGRPPGPNPARSRTRRRWAGSAVQQPAGKRRAAAAGASGRRADLAAPSGGGPATKLAARLLAPTWRAAARCKPTRLHGGGQAGRCCNKTAVQGSWPRSVLAGLSKMAQQ